jgi:hypothetical protein
MSVNRGNGSTGAAIAATDDNDKEKVETVRLTLPPDVANGLVPILLRSLERGGPLRSRNILSVKSCINIYF